MQVLRLNSVRLYWACQIVGWGGYALAQSLAAAVALNLPWMRVVAEALLLHGVALGFTHALRAFMKREHWSSLSKGKLTLRIVGAGMILGVPLGIATHFTSLSALRDTEMLGLGITWVSRPTVVFLLNTLNWSVTFMLWLAIYYGVHALRQYRSAELRQSELARALQLAELRLLKSQLNPHFLFNALNTVRSLITDDPVRAQGAVTRLANTLRYTLASGVDELVTLEHELEIVQDYLELESLRFEDRLKVDCSVTSDARRIRIPVMLLQTVVENAIKHGIGALPAGGVLKIRGELTGGELKLEIENPRPVIPFQNDGEGIGLRNAAERLRLLFGVRASIDVDLSKPVLATVRIRIPEGA